MPWPYPIGNSPDSQAKNVTLYPYIGGRYTYLESKLDLKGLRTFKGSKNWADPLVGIRTKWVFSDRWSLYLAGDIGGFGVGSDFALMAAGVFGYRFCLLGNDKVKFLFGYKALYQDYEQGIGSDKFEFDATFHGPILGLSVPF